LGKKEAAAPSGCVARFLVFSSSRGVD
jgi:hypothetical protein